MKIKKLIKTIKSFAGNNDRTILTGLAIAGVAGTVALAVRATKKYMEKKPEIEQAKTVQEKAKIIAPIVAAPAAVGAVTIGCIIGEHKIASDKIAALSSAATISMNAYKQAKEYTEKLEAELDPDKIEEVKKGIATAKVNEDAEKPEGLKTVINTGYGNQLFRDKWSGQYFRSNKAYVDKVFNDKDYQLRYDMMISLNELYIDLGMETTKGGEEMCWLGDRGDRIKPVYTLVDDTKFNESVYEIEFEDTPRMRYDMRSGW